MGGSKAPGSRSGDLAAAVHAAYNAGTSAPAIGVTGASGPSHAAREPALPATSIAGCRDPPGVALMIKPATLLQWYGRRELPPCVRQP